MAPDRNSACFLARYLISRHINNFFLLTKHYPLILDAFPSSIYGIQLSFLSEIKLKNFHIVHNEIVIYMVI